MKKALTHPGLPLLAIGVPGDSGVSRSSIGGGNPQYKKRKQKLKENCGVVRAFVCIPNPRQSDFGEALTLLSAYLPHPPTKLIYLV